MRLPLFDQLPLFRSDPPASVTGGKAGDKKGISARHIQLGSRVVSYTLRQAARRRLALSIDERGLRVGAPRSITLNAIESFIRDNAQWVLAKLDDFASRAPRLLMLHSGQRIPLLGTEVELRIVAGANRIRWEVDSLVIEARPNADIDVLVRRALQRRAHELFLQRISHYAPGVARPVPPLSLTSARTRWGSCSATGIRLNWRLIHLPLSLVDYVVAHELAHLEQMNHSPRFWAVVERLCPDYQAARAELKRRTADIPLI